MTSTVFVDQITPVPASWLNDVNTIVYVTINGKLTAANNLSDIVNVATARSNLGLLSGATTTVGTMATQNSNAVSITGGTITGITSLAASGANSDITSLSAVTSINGIYYGQGRLTKSGANLLLSPYQGNKLTINGVYQTIPSAGVTLAPPATTLTLYYIYAFMNGATLTLEASATTHATDTTTGVEIKSGDATRTLVGMARTVTNAWVDTAAQRFVVSWFNRRSISGLGFFSTARNTTSATLIELNAEIQNQFLTWADESVWVGADGFASVAGAAGAACQSAIAFDSTTVCTDATTVYTRDTNSNQGSIACSIATSLTEGYHFTTLLGLSPGSGTAWGGSGTAGTRCSLKTLIRG